MIFMNDFKGARSYLDTAISLPRADMQSGVGVLYYNVNGMYYYKHQEPAKALDSYDKGLALAGKVTLSIIGSIASS